MKRSSRHLLVLVAMFLVPAVARANPTVGPLDLIIILPPAATMVPIYFAGLFASGRFRAIGRRDALFWTALAIADLVIGGRFHTVTLLWAVSIPLHFLISLARHERTIFDSRKSDLLWYSAWSVVFAAYLAAFIFMHTQVLELYNDFGAVFWAHNRTHCLYLAPFLLAYLWRKGSPKRWSLSLTREGLRITRLEPEPPPRPSYPPPARKTQATGARQAHIAGGSVGVGISN